MDTTGDKALWEATREDAIPKLELLCQYYVGEVVTSMTNAPLVAGGPESLIYVTASGRIGALLPLSSRDQVDFFTKLYGELRAKAPKPTGRDPWAYRSYYAPAMHVIDGELCDAFSALPHSEQMKVAEAMELTIGEILKKIEDTRNSLL
jgi:splicing factor 3B subunit 3